QCERYNPLIRILLVMKLSVLLILFSLLQVSANVVAQNVNIHVENTSLTQIFKTLKKQTGYDFMYVSADLKDAKPVSLDVTGETLANVLTLCFENQPLTFEIKKS